MAWIAEVDLEVRLPNLDSYFSDAADPAAAKALIIASATGVVASYLRSRYGDQFAAWDAGGAPPAVMNCVANVAVWQSVCRRINPEASVSDGNSPWLLNHDACLKWLALVASGEADLELEDGDQAADRARLGGADREAVF